MRKKLGVCIFALVFLSISFVYATSCTSSSNCSSNETCINSTCTLTTTTSTTAPTSSQQQNLSKIDLGFNCLENKTRGKCSTLSVQEISLVIMATPASDVLTECKDALKAKMDSNNCWPSGNCNLKDTALAVLALDHLGENTDASETWLLSKNQTPTDLIWYLEQDSNSASQCSISYSGNDYRINVADNKKIDSSAGSCLSLAQSNFWLQVSPSCYDTEFAVSCDQNFISTLLYRQSGSSTIFVSSDTKSAAQFGTVNLKISAKCFSTSSSCDYEGSAWATLALLQTGHDVQQFIPYILALSESNKRYLPDAFIFLITQYSDYGTKLIQEQKVGNYWEADASAYNRFYDTALALISLQDSTATQAVKSRDWLLFSQSKDGCWQTNSVIRDTAIVLWALAQRQSSGSTTTSGTTYCSTAGFYCIPSADCPSSDKLTNYFCSGLSTACCRNENLKTCALYSGKTCPSTQVCTGNTRKASDTDYCCLADCTTQTTTSYDCLRDGGSNYTCETQCSSSQDSVSGYTCTTGVCCKPKTTTTTTSSLWIWILVIAIIFVLAIILFLLRSKLKLFFFKMKKEDKSSSRPMSGFPPRPGFPPIVRQPVRPMPSRPMPAHPVQRVPVRAPAKAPSKDKTMDDTFKKLREMSK